MRELLGACFAGAHVSCMARLNSSAHGTIQMIRSLRHHSNGGAGAEFPCLQVGAGECCAQRAQTAVPSSTPLSTQAQPIWGGRAQKRKWRMYSQHPPNPYPLVIAPGYGLQGGMAFGKVTKNWSKTVHIH